MGREKQSMKLISNKTQQRATFNKRKTSLFKKASELSTLCSIPLCAIVFGPEIDGSSSKPETWPPNNDEVRRVIDHYKSKISYKRSVDLRDFYERSNLQLKKQIEIAHRQNDGARFHWIDSLALDPLKEVLGNLDRNLGVLNTKIQCMKKGCIPGPLQYSSRDHLQAAHDQMVPIEQNFVMGYQSPLPLMMFLNGLDCSQIGNNFMYETPLLGRVLGQSGHFGHHSMQGNHFGHHSMQGTNNFYSNVACSKQ